MLVLVVYTLKRLVLNFTFIQVKSNAVRALGYLSRFIRFNHQANTANDPRFAEHYVSINLYSFCSYYSNLQIFWIWVIVIQFFMETLCGLKEWFRLWCLVWQLGMWRCCRKLFYLQVWNWSAGYLFILMSAIVISELFANV